jgi:dihydrofolate reductase
LLSDVATPAPQGAPKLALIWAMADNGVIGAAGGLPWRLPQDLRFFMMTTSRKAVIMGRKTFESMKAPLPRRRNIVVTRDAGYDRAGIDVAASFEGAVDIATRYSAEQRLDEIAVAGGSEIYRLALPQADRLYVTRIHAEIDGDTMFPAVPWDAFARCWHRRYDDLPAHDHSFTIEMWERPTPGVS